MTVFVPFFVDGPLRGRYEPISAYEAPDGIYEHTVKVSPGYVGPIPWPEPSRTEPGDKPWEPRKRIYRYQFKSLVVLGRWVVVGWCAVEEPDDAALFKALMKPQVLSAVVFQREFMPGASGVQP